MAMHFLYHKEQEVNKAQKEMHALFGVLSDSASLHNSLHAPYTVQVYVRMLWSHHCQI